MGYAFYVVTRRDYTYELLEGRTVSKKRSKVYAKRNFDIQKYFKLQTSIALLEEEIENLKKTCPHA